MVNELGPKTDLVMVLSHLGYPKDVELAQTVPGIHIIVGSHTGVNLTNPPVIKNTLIVQNASKGMYGTRIDFTLLDNKAGSYNTSIKRSMERNLKSYQRQLAQGNVSEAKKDQWRRAKESVEQALQQLEGKNYFTYSYTPLSEGIKDHPEIKQMIEAYKSKFKIEEEPSPAPLGKH
jgi:2',3'-cyclic-nucleotide 2'-phosphodiesterase (5'-nucleotidase family)